MKKSSFWTSRWIPLVGLLLLAVIVKPSGARSPDAQTDESKSEATVAPSPTTIADSSVHRMKSPAAAAVRDHRASNPEAGGGVRDHRKKSGDARRSQIELEKAIETAFEGHGSDVLVDGHDFMIKPIRTSRVAREITIVRGKITHVFRFRELHQINYTIRKSDDKITAIAMNFDRGGISRILGRPGDVVAKWVREDGNFLDGTWEGACRQIIGSIAARK